jgi:uncharacterized cupredoxin-like copper-binding protein
MENLKKGRVAAGAVAIAAAGAVALVTSGPSAAAPAQSKAKAKSVSFVLTEFKIAPSQPSVRHGRVTFLARNKGNAPHEIVVIRTSKKAADLPTSKGKASEKGKVGAIPEFRGSKLQRKTFSLKKGHYALICNVPGHYAAKMYVDFNVT